MMHLQDIFLSKCFVLKFLLITFQIVSFYHIKIALLKTTVEIAAATFIIHTQ